MMIAPAEQKVPGTGPRAAAHEALSQTLRRKRPLDSVLDTAVTVRRLDARDAGLARAIANETMRRFGQLDDLLRKFVPKPPPPHRAGPTFEILLAGACELLFLERPPHAAVDGANRLAAADSKAVHFKPLINAALRRIAREGKSIVEMQDASRLNTPDWLWTRWCEAYGEETTRAIANIHLQTPPLDLNFLQPESLSPPLAGEVPAWREEGENVAYNPSRGDEISLRPAFGRSRGRDAPHKRGEENLERLERSLPGRIVRLINPGPVDALPGFAEGTFWVQDFAASLPVRLFGDLRGARVVDLCAAPGGKTAQLCSLGADVTAIDRDESRLERLRANLDRLGFTAELVLTDVRDFRMGSPAPFVLLDAPCSATGTIRRHPELPWIKNASDISFCADTAQELLEAAAAMLAPDGRIVFSVCSLEHEEGQEQVAHFLQRHDEFRRAPITPAEMFGLTECIDRNGDLRTLPSYFAELGGMDGFYAARLTRL